MSFHNTKTIINAVRNLLLTIPELVIKILLKVSKVNTKERCFHTTAETSRVLIVIPTLGPGGAEKQAVVLANTLHNIGYHVSICVQNQQGQNNFHYSHLHPSINIYKLEAGFVHNKDKTLINRILMTNLAHQLHQIVEDQKFSTVISFMDFSNCLNILTFINCTNLGKVLSFRSISPNLVDYRRFYYRPIYQLICHRRRFLVTANSTEGQRTYSKWLKWPKTQISIVDNFAPNVEIDFKPYNGMDVNSIVVGIFRLSIEKRPIEWLQIAQESIKKNPRLMFELYGDGPLRKVVNEYVLRHNLENNVKIKNIAPEVRTILNRGVVLLHCGIAEGQTNVVLEAQAQGVPCVVARKWGVEDLITHGVQGLFYTSGDIEEASARLRSVLSDSELYARLSAASIESAKKRDNVKVIDRWITLITWVSNEEQ